MLTVYNCIVTEHDLRLVGLAAVICALASFTAISLLHHVRRSSGRMRLAWLVVSATSTGFGIWATHFIAMLAFSPGMPSAYNIALTILSLVAAIVLTGTGLAVALTADWTPGPWIGGAMVGGGIAAMHYTGMAAFEIQGRLAWDPMLVASSIALGGLIGAIALPVGLRGDRMKWKLLGALLLTLAICSHHFTAMGAVSIIPDPTIEFSPSAVPAGWLAIAVALASFVIILLTLAGVAVEMRDRRRGELETDRMRGLANAAVEGLLVCDGETIVTVNESFARLIGSPADAVVGAGLEQFFPEEATRLKLIRAAEPADRERIAPRRRLDDAGRTHPAPCRFRRQAPPRHRGPRPAGAQGGRTAHPLSRPSRCAHRDSQSQRFQQEAGPGDTKSLWRRGGGSPSCASTSTGSRRSMICSGMRRATGCCNRWRRGLARCSTTAR